MVDWTERYRPTTLTAIRGNDSARDALREWATTWDDHRQAVILHGSPGVGKTSAAHALAGDMGWPVMELNASDKRAAADIERIAGSAARNATLSGSAGREDAQTLGTSGRQLLILDEADNFHGNADRGGSRAVTRLVKEAEQPVVLVANEFYEMSRSLRNACETIEFRDVSARSIVPVLRDICRKEGIEYDDEALDAIAAATSGDLRSAINDLQAIAEETGRLTEADVVTGERDRTEGIFDFLDALIKEEDAEGALRAAYAVDETPDDLINWIEDNVPKDYEGAELADAYAAIANADRWLGRVRATQNYRFWRYATNNMSAGVAASRAKPKGGWTRYGPPSFWSKLGRSRGRRETRDSIAARIADREGTSVATARREVLPYLSAMTHHCRDRELTVRMTAAYDLDVAEVSFVTGSGKDTKKVESIVEKAADRRAELAVEHGGDAFLNAIRTEEDGPAGDGDRNEGDGDEGDGTNEDGSDQWTLAGVGSEPAESGDATDRMDETSADDEAQTEDEKGVSETQDDDSADDDQSGLTDFV